MAISTYAELKTAIARHLHRTDLDDLIPDFIDYAETVIAGSDDIGDMNALQGVRVRERSKRVTATVSTQYFDVPSNMLDIVDIQLNTDKTIPLTYLSPKLISQKFPSTATGTPKFYTIHGDEFQLAPTPDTSYTLEISYVAKYAKLTDDNDTNWLLTNHPMCYLYPALASASVYLEDDPTRWVSMYKTIVSSINEAESNGNMGSQLTATPLTATP